MTVDLHLDENDPLFNPSYALSDQLKELDWALNQALIQNCYDLRVIHGIGDGVLKNAVHQHLQKQDFVLSYKNEWHPKYGMGSTLIIFKL